MRDDTHVADIRGSIHETTDLVYTTKESDDILGNWRSSRYSPTVKLLLHGHEQVHVKVREESAYTMTAKF
jgi:hypothetical protein